MSLAHLHVAATVAGEPVAVTEIDAREQVLRASPQTAALPRPHTSEGRQLRRWLTQLVVTERVVAAEAGALGVTAADATPGIDDVLPDLTARLEIGSVAAAVLAQPLARAVYESVTAEVEIDHEAIADSTAAIPVASPPMPCWLRICAEPRAAAPSGSGSSSAAPRWCGSPRARAPG